MYLVEIYIGNVAYLSGLHSYEGKPRFSVHRCLTVFTSYYSNDRILLFLCIFDKVVTWLPVVRWSIIRSINDSHQFRWDITDVQIVRLPSDKRAKVLRELAKFCNDSHPFIWSRTAMM